MRKVIAIARSSECDGGTKIAAPRGIGYRELHADASNLAKNRRWSITDERRANQSHFSANSVKHDVYFYKYPTSPYSVSGISFVSTSTRTSTKILRCLFPFLFPVRIYVKVNIRWPCSHMHRNSGAQLLPLLILRKYQRENKDTCILNPEAEISSEWVGLAGWYCRAGCGRCSHFGDEISLSNPAP